MSPPTERRHVHIWCNLRRRHQRLITTTLTPSTAEAEILVKTITRYDRDQRQWKRCSEAEERKAEKVRV